MKIGLYSITYLGCWYRGEALTLAELIGIEFAHKNAELAAAFMREIVHAEYAAKPSTRVAPDLSMAGR